MRKLGGRSVLGTMLALAISGISVAACEVDGETSTSGGNLDNLGDALATTACDKLFECCNAADLVAKVGSSQIVDYAGCHLYYSTVWNGGTEAFIRDSEAKGRLSFNANAFESCLGKMRAQTCTDFAANRALFGCEDAFVGKVAPGGVCSLDLECTTKSCDIADTAAEGTCVQAQAPSGPNEPCTLDDDCDTGLYCTGSTCAVRKADGDACNNGQECQSGACVDDPQGQKQCRTVCEGGGIGRGPTDTVLESVSVPLVEAQCGKALECCTTTELGDAILTTVSTTAECYAISSVYTALALLQIHNAAAEGKVAVDGPALKACADAYTARTCQDYSKFASFDCPDGVKGLVAEGNACTEDVMCASHYCNEPMPNQGTCAVLPTAGTACTGKCDKGLYCDAAGSCVARIATGQPCGADSECLEGRCVAATAGMDTCTLICDGM